jgi:transaldolase
MPESQLESAYPIERLGAPIPSAPQICDPPLSGERPAKPRAASFDSLQTHLPEVAWPTKIDLIRLNVQIFADGADKSGMLKQYANPLIKGFTTNPTLMRKAGITDYEAFARDIIEHIPDRPISLEVFSDDFDEMYTQAIKIAAWGKNVYVKVPVTNTLGRSCVPLLQRLAPAGVKLNVTALFTLEQVSTVSRALADAAPSYISVFAGRIADAGIDPLSIMVEALEIMKPHKRQELIWASPRELFNIVQASNIGCHIITVTNDILTKLPTIGKDLKEFSLDTVKMFHNDALSAGFSI